MYWAVAKPRQDRKGEDFSCWQLQISWYSNWQLTWVLILRSTQSVTFIENVSLLICSFECWFLGNFPLKVTSDCRGQWESAVRVAERRTTTWWDPRGGEPSLFWLTGASSLQRASLFPSGRRLHQPSEKSGLRNSLLPTTTKFYYYYYYYYCVHATCCCTRGVMKTSWSFQCSLGHLEIVLNAVCKTCIFRISPHILSCIQRFMNEDLKKKEKKTNDSAGKKNKFIILLGICKK